MNGGALRTHIWPSSVFDLQVDIIEEEENGDPVHTLLFRTTSYLLCVKEHKGRILGSGVRIGKIKIISHLEEKPGTGMLSIIIRLFDHTNAKHLDLFGFYYIDICVVKKTVNLEHLEVLELRHCALAHNSLP